MVSGNVFLNSNVKNQPWTGSSSGWEWDDAVDAKTDSNLYIYGTIDSNNGTYNGEPLWPLDTCFQPSILGQGTNQTPAYQSGDPGNGLPKWQMSCSDWGGSVAIAFNSIDPQSPQISDPLQGAGAPPDPLSAATNIACPGMGTTPQMNPASQVVGGVTELLPGEYTGPVEITGSVNFEDCSGYSGEGAYPGIYRFDDGLSIDPQSSTDTVTGSNVVISTGNPYPLAGNVPGVRKRTELHRHRLRQRRTVPAVVLLDQRAERARDTRARDVIVAVQRDEPHDLRGPRLSRLPGIEHTRQLDVGDREQLLLDHRWCRRAPG